MLLIRIWILTAFIFLSGNLLSNVYAQNSFDIKEIVLRKTGRNDAGVRHGQSIEQAVQSLGKPTRIEDYFFEIHDKKGYLYYYGTNKLYFIDRTLDAFEISDHSISVSVGNGKKAQIGDKVESGSFVGIPVSKQAGNGFNVNYSASIVSYLKNGAQPLDMTLNFLFNSQNELIFIAFHIP